MTAAQVEPTSIAPDTKINVLLCDDSLVIRGAISRMLRAEPDLNVIASVRNGRAAIDMVLSLRSTTPVDVIVLDVEMPVMNGIEALPHLLAIDPSIRILMASTLTSRNAKVTVDALALGAADYIPKPSSTGDFSGAEFRNEVVAKVRGLGRLRRRERVRTSRPQKVQSASLNKGALQTPARRASSRPTLLAVGSSTGGPQALFTFFRALGKDIGIPVVLTQHMPPSFVPLLAEQITRLGGLSCHEAIDGEPLRADHIHIAPGGRHLTLHASSTGLSVKLLDGPPVNFCKPAVDVMLNSIAPICGVSTVVVILTGMGRDGLAGTKTIVDEGGIALAQDEDSSVVWGMPGAVANAGLCRSVLPPAKLSSLVRELVGA